MPRCRLFKYLLSTMVQNCSPQMRMVSSANWPHVVNLGNSIIGVSILTMPFCFQQCGIILGTILLLFCTWLTLVSCQLLMKAGITSRRKSYEFLAYHTLGGGGKFAIEFLLIGLQLGTMIAQIVVIGDLGPSIVSKFTGFENTNKLRSGLIVILCLFVGLPLGLLKNVRSLSSASTMCVCFYTVFVLYMIFISIPNLWIGNWVVKVRYWRTEGLFQCIPIFSLAFGCQTQLFILYDDLPEPSFKVINKIVSNAVNICSVAYLLVGFFGYIAFCSTEITGDIINMLAPSLFTDIIKMAFVLSIAVTFPLIIFPCRTSLYTMLFPRRPKTSDGFEMSHQIPELHFKLMTVAIVVISMVIGMSVPNVEFILGLNGATMGTLICYIMPALFFLKVMSVTSEGKTLAKLVLVMGILVLLISTYTTLNFQDKSHHAEHQEEKRLKDNIAAKDAVQDIIAAKQPPIVDHDAAVDNGVNHEGEDIGNHVGDGQEKAKDKDAHRHEPPIPKPPDELPDVDQSNEKLKAAEANKKLENEKKDEAAAAVLVKAQGNGLNGDGQAAKDVAKDVVKDVEKNKSSKDDAKTKKQEGEKKQEELLHKLEEQQQEQKKILEEQRELLNELKKHREEEHKDKVVENKPNDQLLPKEGGAVPVAGVQGNALPKLQQEIIIQPGIHANQEPKAPQNVVPQQNAMPQQNIAPQQNVVPQQNIAAHQNMLPQQNVLDQQNVAPQQNVESQKNIAPQQNVVLQQNVAPQQNIMPHQNVAPQQNIVPQQQVLQHNPVPQNILDAQQNIVPQQNVAPQQNIVPQQHVLQQNPVPQQNILVPQQNILPHQNVAPQQNIVPLQQNAVPQKNILAPQQNIVPHQNVDPQHQQHVLQQNPVPQQNILAPQQNVMPHQNVDPQQNIVLQQHVPQQNAVPQKNILAPQQNIMPNQNMVPQQNIIPQKNLASQQKVILQQNANLAGQQNIQVNKNFVPQQNPLQQDIAANLGSQQGKTDKLLREMKAKVIAKKLPSDNHPQSNLIQQGDPGNLKLQPVPQKLSFSPQAHMAAQAEQQQPQKVAQVNRHVANQQGRHLMLEDTEKKEKQTNKPNQDNNSHGVHSNQEHGVRHKRDVLMQMKDEKQFKDKGKSEGLPAFPLLDGIDKKNFPPILMRSLKSANKEDK